MRREVVCWRVSLIVAIGAVAAAAYVSWWELDPAYAVLLIPVVLVMLVLAFLAGRRSALRSAALVLVLLAACFAIFRYRVFGHYVRFEARWILHRDHFEREVLSNPDSQPSAHDVRMKAWDLAGRSNLVYLVFDPEDRLQFAPYVGKCRRSSALPIDALEIWRLEQRWYAVVLYSDGAAFPCQVRP
ncbi:hypothetical protein SAMN05421819_0274 [Bryocella elongata]|uniref:Uncharacterized protein n=1 Tax=Bryocella elongata TaxID=863522 RepID=A0A1H5SPW8_9BACT|nr:hypothetical protein [Bryocella elongata]SEF51807.1 hypothetical protein SAMN05421819_0274 [Bryocella elongata]